MIYLIKRQNRNNWSTNLFKNSDLGTKLTTLATGTELKAEKDKIVKLKTHDLSYFLGRVVFGDDGFQYIFVYQATHTLTLFKVGGGGGWQEATSPLPY